VPVLGERLLKQGIVAFWACYFSIVFLTNLLDALKALEILGDGWEFASGNYPFLQSTTEIYGTPEAINALLFAGVIVWEGLAAGLMWRALGRFGDREGRLPALAVAFAAGLALFAGFVLADEIFIAYEVEGTHFRIWIALLVSYVGLRLLPGDEPARA
jgi:hypothetical protein